MQRGTSPVIGVVLLLAITVLSAAAVGLVVSNAPPEPPPTAAFDGAVDPATRIQIENAILTRARQLRIGQIEG